MTDPARPRGWLLAAALLGANSALADGNGIDAVYHPYVQPLERDIEIRLTDAHADDLRDGQTWRLGYGQALSDRLFAEAYVIAQGWGGRTPHVSGYEVEAQWQLTEQGEFASDWALRGDFERAHDGDTQGASLMLIGERQWERLVGTVNASVGYEWGTAVRDEPKTRLALQGRYRYSPSLEPALELFAAQKLLAAGPALLGTERLGAGRRLHWEAGIAMGLDSQSPEISVRGKLEYEF